MSQRHRAGLASRRIWGRWAYARRVGAWWLIGYTTCAHRRPEVRPSEDYSGLRRWSVHTQSKYAAGRLPSSCWQATLPGRTPPVNTDTMASEVLRRDAFDGCRAVTAPPENGRFASTERRLLVAASRTTRGACPVRHVALARVKWSSCSSFRECCTARPRWRTLPPDGGRMRSPPMPTSVVGFWDCGSGILVRAGGAGRHAWRSLGRFEFSTGRPGGGGVIQHRAHTTVRRSPSFRAGRVASRRGGVRKKNLTPKTGKREQSHPLP